MGLFKKVTKAVTKPFKELGKGWWTEVRTPLAYTAAGAVLGGPLGAVAGLSFGTLKSSSDAQARAAREQAAIEAATAEKQMQAAYNASLQADATPGQEQSQLNEQMQDQQDALRRRRAFSLTKTVNTGRLLGSFASKNTLG